LVNNFVLPLVDDNFLVLIVKTVDYVAPVQLTVMSESFQETYNLMNVQHVTFFLHQGFPEVYPGFGALVRLVVRIERSVDVASRQGILAHPTHVDFEFSDQIWVVDVLLNHVVHDIGEIFSANGVVCTLVDLINDYLNATSNICHVMVEVEGVLSMVPAFLHVNVVPAAYNVVVVGRLINSCIFWKPFRVVAAHLNLH
jgi:hypothetical protein